MPLHENFDQTETRKIKIEPPESETSSEPEKLAESSDSPSPYPPGQGKQGTMWDAALAWIKKEKDSQTFSDEEETKCFPLISSEESKASNSSALSFPQKLWALVGSDWFESSWWGHGGNCTVIDEQFQVEALGRKGPFRFCGTESRKGFIPQINVHGFTPLQRDCIRSPSLPAFQAEEGVLLLIGRYISCSTPTLMEFWWEQWRVQ